MTILDLVVDANVFLLDHGKAVIMPAQRPKDQQPESSRNNHVFCNYSVLLYNVLGVYKRGVTSFLVRRPRAGGDPEHGRRRAGPRGIPYCPLQSVSFGC